MGKAHCILSFSVFDSTFVSGLTLKETPQFRDLMNSLPAGTVCTSIVDLATYSVSKDFRVNLEHPAFLRDVNISLNYQRIPFVNDGKLGSYDVFLGPNPHSLHRVFNPSYDWCSTCVKHDEQTVKWNGVPPDTTYSYGTVTKRIVTAYETL